MLYKIYLGILLLSSSLLQDASGDSRLIVIEINIDPIDPPPVFLRSSDFGYPSNNETLDVIWLFDHSITLKINEFHLDGHRGDFCLISDLPLLHSQDFIRINNTLDSESGYVKTLAEKTLTDQGLLLSWKVAKTIQAVNERGTFVLFHAEAREPGWTAQFKGFDIEVVNYDASVTTTTSTTPDPVVSAKPGQQIYISKFLNCMNPIEFFNNTDKFKDTIAKLATEYCFESEIVLTKGNISSDEVNIPGPKEGMSAGLHYCDPTWPDYDLCVQVTFAVTRVNEYGYYALPAKELEIMWLKKSEDLKLKRYCPYTPPDPVENLNTKVWVAFYLGIILALSVILGVLWARNTKSAYSYRESSSTDPETWKQLKKIEEIDKQAQKHHQNPRVKFNANDNPIYNFIPNPKGYNVREELYPSGDYLEGDLFRKPSFTENPTFQDAHVDVNAYDNSGYEKDEQIAAGDTLPETSRRAHNDDAFVLMSNTSQGSSSESETEI